MDIELEDSKQFRSNTPRILSKTIWGTIHVYRFWPELGMPSTKAMVVIPKFHPPPCQIIHGKKRVKVRITACHYTTKKDMLNNNAFGSVNDN